MLALPELHAHTRMICIPMPCMSAQLVLRLACQFEPDLRPDFAALADMLGGAIRHMEAQQVCDRRRGRL